MAARELGPAVWRVSGLSPPRATAHHSADAVLPPLQRSVSRRVGRIVPTQMRELRRVAPGTRPVGERDVPPQQVVDVRPEAELSEQERDEGHDEETLEDIGRRPPSL